MLDTNSVKAKFLVISGIDEADSQIETVCACSALKFSEMLKNDSDGTDERVIYAAACDAYCQWVLMCCTASEEAFKSMRAGDITITSDLNSILKAAKEMKEASLEGVSSLLSDNRFYFSEVDINDG